MSLLVTDFLKANEKGQKFVTRAYEVMQVTSFTHFNIFTFEIILIHCPVVYQLLSLD